jgi:hypothetical protein
MFGESGREILGHLPLLQWKPEPTDVVEREQQIADFIAGRRLVQEYNGKRFCT